MVNFPNRKLDDEHKKYTGLRNDLKSRVKHRETSERLMRTFALTLKVHSFRLTCP